MGERISRRDILKVAGAAGTAAAIPAGAQTPPQPEVPASITPALPRYEPPAAFEADGPFLFLTESEAAFLTAAAARLIPGDALSPSAADAGAVTYLDRQLAGTYGSGERLYLQGPWKEGTPRQGYQLRFTPRELYRTSLTALDRLVRERFANRSFATLGEQEQDDFLRELEAGQLDLDGVPSAVLFETLLANVIESYFADPVHGGNRDYAGWRLVGFPGAYAQFGDLVEQHGRPYRREPMGIAQAARQHPHQG